MKIKIWVLVGAVLLFFTGCRQTVKENVVLPLTDKEIEDALDYGEKNASFTLTEFTSDWTVDKGYHRGKGKATIVTPFLRVALLGRQAALTGEKLDSHLIKTALKEDIESLNFEVTLYGSSSRFARSTKFLLKCGKKQVQPDYFFMPPYGEIARDYTQVAKGRVMFKKEGIPDDAEVILVASFNTDEEMKEVSICRFPFDLKRYK